MTILLYVTVLVPVLTWCRSRGIQEREVDEMPFWVTTLEDSLLADRILADLKRLPEAAREGHDGQTPKRVPVADLMVRAGKALEGQPYVAGTLDENPDGNAWKEELRIYLTRTDCIIFVETCLALARTAVQGGYFQVFADEIRRSRYRDGQVGTYADRLHYTTEWARQAVKRGVLKDVTRALGGEPLDHPVNYMSTHQESYPLMDDVEAICEAEGRINSEPRYYIPKSHVSQAVSGIRSGDIICLVTSIEGLDVSHVGMALAENGKVRLLHASTGPMKVVTESRTIEQYLAARPAVIGIQVLRPQ